MNLKSLSGHGRKLVEAISETDADGMYDLIDAEEDGDTIMLTFSRIVDLNLDDEE